MRILVSIIFLTMLNAFSSFSQMGDILKVKYINETGKSILVTQTDYSQDSIISTSSYSMNIGSIRITSDESIRKDFILIDKNNNDTISKITTLKEDYKLGPISFSLGEETLLPPIKTKPKLRIKSTKPNGFQSIYSSGSMISFKIKSGEKYTGKIYSYNKNTITILAESGIVVSVPFSEIKSVKICNPLLLFAFWAFFQEYCRNYSQKKISIHLVQQEWDPTRQNWSWHRLK